MDYGLSNEQIKTIAPSVFAEHPGPRTSDRYAYIGSGTMIERMRSLGFSPVMVREGKKKQPQGRAFAMHEIRFQKADHMKAVAEAGLGGLIPQVLLRNSHDTTSPLSLEAGALRVACLNGMCMPGEEFGGFRVRHYGNVDKRADETGRGMEILMEKLGNVVEVAQSWRKIHLMGAQVDRLVAAAAEARGTSLTLDPHEMLMVRRPQDLGDSLWHLFNRLQENMTKGGAAGRTSSGRRSSLRPVSTLAADVAFNRKLWAAASAVAADARPISVSVLA